MSTIPNDSQPLTPNLSLNMVHLRRNALLGCAIA